MAVKNPSPQEVERNSSLTTQNLGTMPDAIKHADVCAWYKIKPPTLTRWTQQGSVRVYHRVGTKLVVVSHLDVLKNLHRLPDRLITPSDAAQRYGIPYCTLQSRIRKSLFRVEIEKPSGLQKSIRKIHEKEVRTYIQERVKKGKPTRMSRETSPSFKRKRRVNAQRLCTICESAKRVHKNRTTGELVCETCTNRLRTPVHEVCAGCGDNRIVAERIEGNRPLCQTCYRRKNPEKSRPKYGICTRCDKGPQLISYVRPGTRRNICKTCHEELRSRLPIALQR